MENKIFDFILNNKSNFEKDVLPVIVKEKTWSIFS